MTSPANNYFSLFGLPLSFDIDRNALDSAYRQLQQVSHPDRFVNEATEFQRQAVQQTAQNAEAHQVLKNPVQRACHLLAAKGLSFDLSSYTVTDINLLMEQMTLREQLADIKDAADFDQLLEFADSVELLNKNTVSKIAKLLGQESWQESEENLSDIKNHICELQFLNKLVSDLDEVEEQLMQDH